MVVPPILGIAHSGFFPICLLTILVHNNNCKTNNVWLNVIDNNHRECSCSSSSSSSSNSRSNTKVQLIKTDITLLYGPSMTSDNFQIN
uniref:Uncharacterized protein n=1 Tax=Glossina palpalis gambiensis TaxID=67801 RepID=A0A1B0BI56_9MUSC